MSAKIIDGKKVAKQIEAEVKKQNALLWETHQYRPGLATVLIGEDPASATYVRMKHKACDRVGIRSLPIRLAATISQLELEKVIVGLNNNPEIDGILVQLPLPDHLDPRLILNLISIEKDVDGFHPFNIGQLAIRDQMPDFIPCTPYGVLHLLQAYKIPMHGANAVVIGRSTIVGLPMFFLLQKEHATVTLCHRYTKDLGMYTKQADIVVVAAGVPGLVTGDMIKKGATVIDVGTNHVRSTSTKSGYQLVGDADFASVSKVAGWITPVPGGVGPMTIGMLMHNTALAAERRLAKTH